MTSQKKGKNKKIQLPEIGNLCSYSSNQSIDKSNKNILNCLVIT
jgi:hypothetical protein